VYPVILNCIVKNTLNGIRITKDPRIDTAKNTILEGYFRSIFEMLPINNPADFVEED
jgi:hypothetical protein